MIFTEQSEYLQCTLVPHSNWRILGAHVVSLYTNIIRPFHELNPM